MERVREYADRNPRATQQELERQARIEACGAKNQETFAHALQSGLVEASLISSANTQAVSVSERAVTVKE